MSDPQPREHDILCQQCFRARTFNHDAKCDSCKARAAIARLTGRMDELVSPGMTDLELALNKHKYRLDGVDLVNVTAISGLLDDGKSGAFAGAAVKLTKEWPELQR